MNGSDDDWEALMAIRGDWLLRGVRVCHLHGRPLVDLWTESAVSERYDIQSRMREIGPAVLAGELDRDEVAVTPYDTWLDQRLADGSDRTWLGKIPIRAVVMFCDLLGGELLAKAIVQSEGRDPLVAGFEVASCGHDGILTSLDDLFYASPRGTDKLQVVYGQLYRKLRWGHIDDPAYATFFRLFRKHVAARWAIAEGEDLVGEPLSARRRHSTRSVAQATGISEPLLERILISVGAIAADEPIHLGRRTFDADEHVDLVERLTRLVGSRNFKRLCGITKDQFAAVVEVGLLTPFLDPAATEHPWDQEDGYALLARLMKGAQVVTSADTGWENLRVVCARRRMTLSALFDALGKGEIRAERMMGIPGFSAIMVRSSEVDAVFPSPLREETTVAEFARGIGLRDGKTLPAMIEKGIVDP